MAVLRVLFNLALLGLIAWLLRRWLRSGKPAAQSSHSDPEKSKAAPVQSMVVCSFCGVHLPQSEAIGHQGLAFCSGEHRDGWAQGLKGRLSEDTRTSDSARNDRS